LGAVGAVPSFHRATAILQDLIARFEVPCDGEACTPFEVLAEVMH
jgi:hypothetical protein